MNADRDHSEAPQDTPRATESGEQAQEVRGEGSGAERAAERRTAQPVQTASPAQVQAAWKAYSEQDQWETAEELWRTVADAVVAADVRPPRGEAIDLAEAYNLGCRDGSTITMKACGVGLLSKQSMRVTDAIDMELQNPFADQEYETFTQEFERLVGDYDTLRERIGTIARRHAEYDLAGERNRAAGKFPRYPDHAELVNLILAVLAETAR